jgi:hypothetical protein
VTRDVKKKVRSIATKWCRGATVETVYCHDIFRGNKEKIVYCHETPIIPRWSLTFRGNNTNLVYCHEIHEMRFHTKFHRRCLGKLLNRVKLHVHNSVNSRNIFLFNHSRAIEYWYRHSLSEHLLFFSGSEACLPALLLSYKRHGGCVGK